MEINTLILLVVWWGPLSKSRHWERLWGWQELPETSCCLPGPSSSGSSVNVVNNQEHQLKAANYNNILFMESDSWISQHTQVFLFLGLLFCSNNEFNFPCGHWSVVTTWCRALGWNYLKSHLGGSSQYLQSSRWVLSHFN